MSSYSSFAVIGAGTLGGPILAALAAQPSAKVILLSRSASKSVPENVQVVQVPSYEDVAAVAAALKAHNSLVDAAKQAGIKLFVPSEFGASSEGQTEGPLGEKNKIVGSYSSLCQMLIGNRQTGLFIEYVSWVVNYNAEAKKLYVVGKADGTVSTTSIGDIAGYLAHVLTQHPPAVLENKILRIEGDRIPGYRSLGPLFGAQVETVDTMEDLADRGVATTGHGVRGMSDEEASRSGNALWAGHRWETIRDFYGL
ncbi:unnamed protein product [Mycena citricolor]|uniref:NmrA-like domain-containing protein n=1 Tax=Mycena citricolor TaxID=2018698 RepID=A0AAD2H0V7_9AGAR|nr:unnamed protein product [Mycena citricolor]